MHHYEIRIMGDDGHATLLLAATHANDNEAIQAAQRIARRRKFEVWKGMDCVYGTQGVPFTALPSLDLPNSL